MSTDKQTVGPAGKTQRQWTDPSGVVWEVTAQWTVLNGRAECTTLTMDSHGKAPVTSTLVRQVERVVRETWRAPQFDSLRKLAQAKGMPEVARRAARQVPAFDPEKVTDRPPTPGRPRDDAAWLERAQAMRAAWEQGTSFMDALRRLEHPDSKIKDGTLRKRIDRTRAWDREHGPGILRGIGRQRQHHDDH